MKGKEYGIPSYEEFKLKYEKELLHKCGIYKIKNKINGKMYIGQSKNIYARWRRHQYVNIKMGIKESSKPLYRSMRYHGINNFDVEIVEECQKELLDGREIYYIKTLNTKVPKGYNLDSGGRTGDGTQLLDDVEVESITKELKEKELTNIELAKKYGISRQTLGAISRGISYYRENIDYPIRKFRDNEVHNKRIKEKDERYKLKNKCKTCGKDMYSYHSRLKYCSIKCKRGCGGEYTGNCLECGEDIRIQKDKYKFCSPKCSNKNRVKLIIKKEDLYEMLKEKPSYTEIGEELGVSGNTIKKRCRDFGLEDSIRYWWAIYEITNGYTYHVYKMYQDLKEKNPDVLKYVIDNYTKKSKRIIVEKDKVVGPAVYDAIGIIHNLKRYDPDGRVKNK